MATADYWAEPKVVREQIVLFAPPLPILRIARAVARGQTAI